MIKKNYKRIVIKIGSSLLFHYPYGDTEFVYSPMENIVDQISKVPVGERDLPIDPVVIESVTIQVQQ